MAQRLTALILSLAIGLAGCATSTARHEPVVGPATADAEHGLMAAYVQRLPIGGRIRATLLDGSRVRGTLMKATDTVIVVQPRTRMPEAPVEVPVGDIAAIEIETPSNVGRSIAIGVVAGVAGALGVIAILAAALGDD